MTLACADALGPRAGRLVSTDGPTTKGRTTDTTTAETLTGERPADDVRQHGVPVLRQGRAGGQSLDLGLER